MVLKQAGRGNMSVHHFKMLEILLSASIICSFIHTNTQQHTRLLLTVHLTIYGIILFKIRCQENCPMLKKNSKLMM